MKWLDWLNSRLLLEPIGSVPPAEAGERCDAVLEEPAIAAQLRRGAHRRWQSKIVKD